MPQAAPVLELVMFHYFGSKARLARWYPPPHHSHIVEPFAGSAGYACRYPNRDVTLIDRDERIVALWERLRAMTPDEVLAIPCPQVGEQTSDLLAMLRTASEHSLTDRYLTVTPRLVSRWPTLLARIARLVPSIQHWTILHGDYTLAPDVEATWFIDPPYQQVPRGYAHRPDFEALGAWCRTRHGQVIVCEQAGADWLPFVPLVTNQGATAKRTVEVVWPAPSDRLL